MVGYGISPSRTPQIYQQCVGVIQQAIRVSARKPEQSVAPSVIEMMSGALSFKEVIQPQVPLRLPCYDFVPLTGHTFDASLLAVGTTTTGAANSGGLTGGVYKAQEQIHRGVADPRLLAIPTS